MEPAAAGTGAGFSKEGLSTSVGLALILHLRPADRCVEFLLRY